MLQHCNRCRFFSQLCRFCGAAALLYLLFWTRPLWAEPYDLAACIDRAMRIHPGVQAAEVDVDLAHTLLDQANAARILPKFELTSVLGPSPEARGDALIGDTDLSRLSLFTRTEATFVQPLYTFGKLAGTRSAAEAGVRAYQAGLTKTRADLALQVAEAYHGLLLADELWALAKEAEGDFQTARNFVAEKLDADEGDFTYSDLARIDRFAYDVSEKVHAAFKLRALAASGLRLLLGLSEADSLKLADTLRPMKVEIQPLNHYLSLANARPELQQLSAAIAARRSLVQVARSDQYPQFFIAGQFKYGYAPNRDNPESPFAYDPINILQAGAVVGFRQSLSFGLTSAKARKARLEHQKLVYQAQLAQKGVAIDIEKIYLELKEARGNLRAAQKARKAARRWFVSVRDGFNIGLEEASDMIDAVKEYGIIRAKYYEAVFNFNRAWVKLQRATGQPIAP